MKNRTKPAPPKTMVKREQMKPNHPKAISGKPTLGHPHKNLGRYLHPKKAK
jgi:hypothetical protein